MIGLHDLWLSLTLMWLKGERPLAACNLLRPTVTFVDMQGFPLLLVVRLISRVLLKNKTQLVNERTVTGIYCLNWPTKEMFQRYCLKVLHSWHAASSGDSFKTVCLPDLLCMIFTFALCEITWQMLLRMKVQSVNYLQRFHKADEENMMRMSILCWRMHIQWMYCRSAGSYRVIKAESITNSIQKLEEKLRFPYKWGYTLY